MRDNLSLYCIKYAESVLPENLVFFGGDKNKKLPISFAIYLIKTNDINILVDAGCDTMPGFNMKNFCSPAFALRTFDLSPDEITDVLLTHADHDHVEAVKHFGNAVVHISKQEYPKAKRFIPENMSIEVFEDQLAITPQIKIIKWGGHTSGSSIVEITNDDKTYVLAGDECYYNDCIINKIPTGAYYNLDKSREFVEKYSNKKYRVCTSHDISLKTEKII